MTGSEFVSHLKMGLKHHLVAAGVILAIAASIGVMFIGTAWMCHLADPYLPEQISGWIYLFTLCNFGVQELVLMFSMLPNVSLADRIATQLGYPDPPAPEPIY